MTLTEAFSGLPDTRTGPAVRYALSEIMIMATCAILCGSNNWVEIADWCRDRKKWLKDRFGFARTPPSHDTFGNIFRLLDPKVFETRFREWINALAGIVEGVVAIDGKTLRGSGKKGSNELLHMVTAYATQSGLCLAQEGTCGKGNELAGIKALLDVLALKGCIVTMDALGCQKEVVENIVERGGDYVLQVKDNQKNLAEVLREFFERGEEAGYGKLAVGYCEQVEKNHGRFETRRYTWVNDLSWMDKPMRAAWMKLGGVGMIESSRLINGKESVEYHYAIGSTGVKTVKAFAQATRAHWGIENGLHWTLDVVFREDECRARTGHSARNLSVLRKCSISMLRKDKDAKQGLHRRRLHADRDESYREFLIGKDFTSNAANWAL
jgi:predicted transposase YbfD/YdcC